MAENLVTGEYKSVFTSDLYEERVSGLQAVISELTNKENSFYQERKQTIEQEIDILKQKHNDILKKFSELTKGKISTLEDLKLSLIEFKNTDPLPFSGGRVRRFFSERSANFYDKKTIRQIDELFSKIILKNMKTNVEKGLKKFSSTDFHNWVMQEFKGDHRYYHSERGFIKINDIELTEAIIKGLSDLNISNILDNIENSTFQTIVDQLIPEIRKLVDYGDMTAAQQQRFKDWLKIEGDQSIDTEYVEPSSKSQAITWQVILKQGRGANGEKIKATSKNTTNEERKKINKEFTDYLLSLCSSSQQPYIRNIIEAMMTAEFNITQEESTMFLTGSSDTQIVGIFGEIEAMYYLAKLFSPFEAPSVSQINEWLLWRGGVIDKNKKGEKPHQDILLQDAFGIQVKNTQRNLLTYKGIHSVSFQNLSLEGFLDKIAIQDNTIRNIFKNYFYTYLFNVPYKIDNRRTDPYIETTEDNLKGDNGEKFKISYENLHLLSASVDQLLSSFASIFLYMDQIKEVVEDTSQENDLNTLYIFGGVIPVTALTILEDVIKQFEQTENVHPITVTAGYKDKTAKDNIVSVLNLHKKQDRKTITTNFKTEVNLVAHYNISFN